MKESAAQLVECRLSSLLVIMGVGSNPLAGIFGRFFFFIIGEKGWAHPKVFRLPHPSMTKCLAFRILGYRKGLYNWFLQWNKRFTVREIFFATWKSAGFFLQFLVQKWTKKESTPNFFWAMGLCINVPNDRKRERNFFFSKNVARNRIFPFWGSDPFIAPPGTPRGPGIFFLDWYYLFTIV